MKISREFAPADHYTCDIGLCSCENGPARIDPGFDPAMKRAFVRLGSADMMH